MAVTVVVAEAIVAAGGHASFQARSCHPQPQSTEDRLMPCLDLPLDQLRAYRPALEPPADLAAFWSATLGDARTHDLAATFTPVATGLTLIDTFDVTFAAFGGDPIRAWLRVPAGATRPVPAVVQFVGYGGGRGLAHQDLLWPVAGYAFLIMDTRG
jgi:cephalosporin-C deacetylase